MQSLSHNRQLQWLIAVIKAGVAKLRLSKRIETLQSEIQKIENFRRQSEISLAEELRQRFETLQSEIQKIENFRRQSEISLTEELRQRFETLQSEIQKTERFRRQSEVSLTEELQQIGLLQKAPKLPFNIEVNFQPLLSASESRIGTKVRDLNATEKELQFYTYFSEMGGEHSQEILRQQYEFYLNYIPRNSGPKFLDLGCGSGEFLAFLQKNGISALGIDSEFKEVERAKRAGLNAICADGKTFLNSCNDKYIGISMIQVIEHIPSEAVAKLLQSAVERLLPDGIMLIETLNIRHPLAFNSFYVDPTHTRPVTIEYLSFLMEWAGLENIHLLYSLPVWIPGVDNQDVSRTYMNYTLIGQKPTMPSLSKT